jgi:hypothetical protein
MGAPPPVVPPAPGPASDDVASALQTVAKYIPTEVVGPYVALLALIAHQPLPAQLAAFASSGS